MLPYALAIVVGLSSFVLFLTAFFFRDIHRKDDFLWSGIGLFYALVLWFCATSIRGAVLLGQVAVVALLTAYFWQVFKLRDAIAHPEQQADFQDFSVLSSLQNLFSRSNKKNKADKGSVDDDAGDTVIETKEEPPSQSVTVPETIADETVDTAIETKEEPVKIKKVALKPNKVSDPVKATVVKTDQPKVDREAQTPPTPTSSTNLSETDLNELLDASEPEPEAKPESKPEPTKSDPVTPEVSNSETEKPEVLEEPPANTEAVEPEVTEIAVEQVTVIEEETNWDDEVDDLPASAVTVIQAETAPETEESSSEKDRKTEKEEPQS